MIPVSRLTDLHACPLAERRLANACTVTSQNVPSEAWCGEWNRAEVERKESLLEEGFSYQTAGALKPVISGTTPYGPERGLVEFKPHE